MDLLPPVIWGWDVMCTFCPQRFNWNLSSLHHRQESSTEEDKERGEIILNKEELGYTVFHSCLSIIKHINFCLGLNTNWKTQRNKGTVPLACYLVKEAPHTQLLSRKKQILQHLQDQKQKKNKQTKNTMHIVLKYKNPTPMVSVEAQIAHFHLYIPILAQSLARGSLQ